MGLLSEIYLVDEGYLGILCNRHFTALRFTMVLYDDRSTAAENDFDHEATSNKI